MPRYLLTAKQIVAARDRDLVDGEGLIVRVKETSCTAVLRFTSPASHKRRELGLGLVSRQSLQAAGETLVAARGAAEDARRLIRDGLDPIEVRDAKRAEARAMEEATSVATKSAATTLRRFARNYHDEHVEPLRSARHAQQWINSIERNVPAKFLDRPIDSITPVELLDTLVPIMRRVPDTGSRIYRRLSTVFDAAVIGGLIAANPAGPIQRELRRRVGQVERTNYAALDYRKLPAFIKRLQTAPGTAARCLEFAILTGARTTEALNAEWSEIDFEARTWTIPVVRMKARQKHMVYLGTCPQPRRPQTIAPAQRPGSRSQRQSATAVSSSMASTIARCRFGLSRCSMTRRGSTFNSSGRLTCAVAKVQCPKSPISSESTFALMVRNLPESTPKLARGLVVQGNPRGHSRRSTCEFELAKRT